MTLPPPCPACPPRPPPQASAAAGGPHGLVQLLSLRRVDARRSRGRRGLSGGGGSGGTAWRRGDRDDSGLACRKLASKPRARVEGGDGRTGRALKRKLSSLVPTTPSLGAGVAGVVADGGRFAGCCVADFLAKPFQAARPPIRRTAAGCLRGVCRPRPSGCGRLASGGACVRACVGGWMSGCPGRDVIGVIGPSVPSPKRAQLRSKQFMVF